VPNSQAVELTPDVITQIRGELQMIDVTITHVGALYNVCREYQALRPGGMTDPNPAMRCAAARKVRKYKPLIDVTGGGFIPFVISSLGTLSHVAYDLCGQATKCSPEALRTQIQFIVKRRNYAAFNRWRCLNGALRRPAAQIADPPADQIADQPAHQIADQPVDLIADQPADQIANQPADPPVDLIAPQAVVPPVPL
jgi:hypothetical protein